MAKQDNKGWCVEKNYDSKHGFKAGSMADRKAAGGRVCDRPKSDPGHKK
jgi:hypothetical protein